MKTSSASDKVRQHPAFNHYLTIGALDRLAHARHLPKAVREEAKWQLAQYRNDGIIIQEYKEADMARQRSRPLATPPKGATVFTGQGIVFAVVDDREQFATGRTTTIDVITEGIEAALDAGYETSEDIARYLTTSAFQHVPDKRVRFNSVLKAGDVVGAQMLRKLYNAYNELEELAGEAEDTKDKATLKAEAQGFAEALQIVLSPFSCEDATDPRLVDWDTVDRLTADFIKEQRAVRRERKGTPQ